MLAGQRLVIGSYSDAIGAFHRAAAAAAVPGNGSLERVTLESSVRFVVAFCLICCWSAPSLWGQNISDIAIDGLPAGMAMDDLVMALAEKKGALFAKSQEPGDRTLLVNALQDAGYLDADVKSAASFIPGGVKLVFTVSPRNQYHIEAVKVAGLSKTDVQAILDALKITTDSLCTHDVCQHLSDAIADKLGVNVLFLVMEHKLNVNKRDATLLFSH